MRIMKEILTEDELLLHDINKSSHSEGWGIYLAIGSNNSEYEWQIERHDDSGIFKDDIEAMKFIVSKAINERTQLHLDALKFMYRNGSIQELKTILNSIVS